MPELQGVASGCTIDAQRLRRMAVREESDRDGPLGEGSDIDRAINEYFADVENMRGVGTAVTEGLNRGRGNRHEWDCMSGSFAHRAIGEASGMPEGTDWIGALDAYRGYRARQIFVDDSIFQGDEIAPVVGDNHITPVMAHMGEEAPGYEYEYALLRHSFVVKRSVAGHEDIVINAGAEVGLRGGSEWNKCEIVVGLVTGVDDNGNCHIEMNDGRVSHVETGAKYLLDSTERILEHGDGGFELFVAHNEAMDLIMKAIAKESTEIPRVKIAYEQGGLWEE